MYIEANKNLYYSLWNKYRPVILQLMIGAESGEQQYSLSGHEFKAVGEKVKSSYVFSLVTVDGKASKVIGRANLARDLVLMLQQSKTGAVLMSEASYELKMDKNFLFYVTRLEVYESENEDTPEANN